MSSLTHTSPLKEISGTLLVHISYECLLRERVHESASYTYELACSITYPSASAHLSLRVTGQNTYRNAAPRDIPFTRHEAGATAYVELLESEQLEVRVVEQDGTYCKAFYVAQRQDLSEQNARRILSTIQRL
ncbi:MAG TPA: hypothetical protein VKR06_10590 [Ktedonosporobacter sp.]|nr:hypothetical protein [Ktedonosporobacter sp.]